ncbi:MAG: hypothetical protein CMJ78_23535 [Planctomycetaceae bacterium]|nr:hypothetical protein [Planctomycetaceae bacterium]
MGDVEIVHTYQKRWNETPRDELADCRACECSTDVELLAFIKKDEEAIEAAQPLLNGEESCSTVPQSTYGHVLLPLIRPGRAEEAAKIHSKGYSKIAGNPKFLVTASEHLQFLVHQRKLVKAVQVLERHYPLVLESAVGYEQYYFYRAAQLLFEALARNGSRPTRKFRFQESCPIWREDRSYEVAAVLDFFCEQTKTIAQQFDQRNGNDHFSQQVEEYRELFLGDLA